VLLFLIYIGGYITAFILGRRFESINIRNQLNECGYAFSKYGQGNDRWIKIIGICKNHIYKTK